MRILLLSAYDAESHRYWREGLVAHFPQYTWQVLHLAPRYFSWRVRGNSLSWAGLARDTLEQDYDLLIATSMCDLSALRGMVPRLAQLPTVLYFHENQFAYPESAHQHKSVEPQILSLYSALCADRLLFNSHYNQHTFLDGVQALLRKLPDAVPRGIDAQLASKSQVLPVPLRAGPMVPDQPISRSGTGPLNILWNHRWEYDKGPALLLEIVTALKARSVDFRMHVVGQQFRQQPAEFARIHRVLGKHLGQWGYVAARADYDTLLASTDVVLSTALHDFQGLSIMEAVAAGCLPAVPRRLAYPEWFGDTWCYAGPNEADAAVAQLEALAQQKKQGCLPSAPDLSAFAWQALGPRYARLLSDMAGI